MQKTMPASNEKQAIREKVWGRLQAEGADDRPLDSMGRRGAAPRGETGAGGAERDPMGPRPFVPKHPPSP